MAAELGAGLLTTHYAGYPGFWPEAAGYELYGQLYQRLCGDGAKRGVKVAMENQPGFIERLAERMEGLPEGRQEEFLRVAARAYVDRQRREATAAGEPASLPELPLTTADQSTAPLR